MVEWSSGAEGAYGGRPLSLIVDCISGLNNGCVE